MTFYKTGTIITGKIENVETGKTTDIYHYLLHTGFNINTIIKINYIECYSHPDNSKQICIDCNALDSIGNVFAICIDYSPKDDDEMTKIVNDFKQYSFYYIEGEFTVTKDNPPIITIHSPKYSPLPEEFLEVDIEKAFIMNS